MSQRKILTQLQLKKNHKGTFCADIEVEGQKLCAFLSNKVIEGGKLYTYPIEDSHYWASINISKTSAFINQLLPLSQYNKRSSELEYGCYCQRLEDGRIQLTQEQGDDYIVLPKGSVYSKLYRIFYNSLVVVTFSHDTDYQKGGFVIQQWQTKEPEYVNKGVVTNIRKKTDDPTTYLADYYVAKGVFLPVLFYSSQTKKLGIHSVTEQAILPASIIFDDKGCKAKTSLPANTERLLALHNQPMADLIFVETELREKDGKEYKLYRFVTPLIEGISLNVEAWQSDLEHFIKDVSALQPEDTIKVHLSYYMNKEWCNFKLSVATEDEYHQRFRCIEMKHVSYVDMALFEAIESPYIRVLVERSELVRNRIYAIHSGVEFDLHIIREESKKPWQIKYIDRGLFIGINSDKAYKAECTVGNIWSRYDNHPDYVMKIERSQKNYAFKNHAIASVRSKHVDLALIIPKSLLIARGFRTLDIGKKLSVAFKEITFPVFTTEAIRILCADDLQDSDENQGGAGGSVIVFAEYIEQLPDHIGKKPPYKATPKYGFSIIDSDDSAIFTDWEHQMSQVDEPEKYRYKVRTEASKWGIEVKELISASIK
ncbi:hypothetical protein [Psychrobacter sp. DAB_AL62B]|uniref:hypothetical protein n=1 Tax=Psychrobacter sp. DAB_AL62B TaxID=1028420 RepID=UPI002380CCCA|nr:hypothetical protein [Psychrobacter sp. DAB_AL62B]MDE4456132.1 hypothetical protein [Psychrobacter sp. DAB_AL62B]